MSLDTQLRVALERVRSAPTNLEKYLVLASLQRNHEDIYYALLMQNMHELTPFVYTPTVGLACQEWSNIYPQAPRGLYLSLRDKGRVRSILDNWPHQHIRAIVFTDGERILGLGDLGTNGMGIPVGKLALYTACGGIHPDACLPVHIDVGTENEALLDDPAYVGLRQRRERGPAYDELIAEFIDAAKDKYGPQVLLQFEDFGNRNAFRLLDEYTEKATCFNDDIQGTASVILAGLLASKRLTGKALGEHTFLFYGAGEAGVGIANLVASAIQRESGCGAEEARSRIFLMDSRGLITASRAAGEDLAHHKRPFAHSTAEAHSLLDAVHAVKPSVLIGVSAQSGAFDRDVLSAMTQHVVAADERAQPIVLSLSNPTSKSECTAEQAYAFSDNRAIFASGSPFDPVTLSSGQVRVPGQGNNAYIFPGVGLGAIAAGSTRIDNDDMYVAAKALSECVSQEQLERGCLYPPLAEIRRVSAHIAAAVAEAAHEKGHATLPRPENLRQYVEDIMYDPTRHA